MGAANSLTAQTVTFIGSSAPPSFNGDGRLFAFSLFLMTAFMCLGLMKAGKQLRDLWCNRATDRWPHPVTIWRLLLFFAGSGVFLRCGSEAMNLWAWNPQDPTTTARVMMSKRWVDLAALGCAAAWMTIATLSSNAMIAHLRQKPLPVNLWASIHTLKRPAVVVAISLFAAVGVVVTR